MRSTKNFVLVAALTYPSMDFVKISIMEMYNIIPAAKPSARHRMFGFARHASLGKNTTAVCVVLCCVFIVC